MQQLTPAVLQQRIAAARSAAAKLRRRPIDDVLAALDRVVARWVDGGSEWLARAARPLSDATGFSPEMIRHALPLLLAPLRAPAIAAVLDAELGDRRMLEDWRGGRRAFGPQLVVHVLAGNIPGLSAAPTLLSLALGSAVLLKCAAGDPVFPPLFAESIREADELLGDCVAVAAWRGGDDGFESVAFEAAGLVVASGSDAAVAALASRVPCRFIGHGHRVSFAAVSREALADDESAAAIAARLSYDTSLWDQQGCLSPQLCFVESGGAVAPRRFAEMLAVELDARATDLPPRRRSFEEEAAVLRFRQEAEWSPAAELLASRGTSNWSVSLEAPARFLPSCANRCLRVVVVERLEAIAALTAPHRRHLEAAGLAAVGERRADLADMLARCGVHRVCAVGCMQSPPLSWMQGGRPRVGDWAEWAGWEEDRQ